MPHLIIEHSANIEKELDLPRLVSCLHTTTSEIKDFPMAGLRTRIAKRDIFCIADGHPDNSFVHVTLRIRHGRSMDTKKKAAESIFESLTTYLDTLLKKKPLAISFEIQEIDPELSFRKGNIRDHLKRRGTG